VVSLFWNCFWNPSCISGLFLTRTIFEIAIFTGGSPVPQIVKGFVQLGDWSRHYQRRGHENPFPIWCRTGMQAGTGSSIDAGKCDSEEINATKCLW
jgi:hypothetical protein